MAFVRLTSSWVTEKYFSKNKCCNVFTINIYIASFKALEYNALVQLVPSKLQISTCAREPFRRDCYPRRQSPCA